jgi:hypothetical protein
VSVSVVRFRYALFVTLHLGFCIRPLNLNLNLSLSLSPLSFNISPSASNL